MSGNWWGLRQAGWIVGVALILVVSAAGQEPDTLPVVIAAPRSAAASEPAPEPEPLLVPEVQPLVHFRGPGITEMTWLPGNGKRGFDDFNIELGAALSLGLYEDQPPFVIAPGFGVHFWKGPISELNLGSPDLPDQVYDAFIRFGWRPRLQPWLFVDLNVTPGWYGDYEPDSVDTFRLRGHAIGIVALSERFQILGGAIYANRNHVDWLPAGGIIYRPSDDLKFQLVFPEPKVACRLVTFHGGGKGRLRVSTCECWLYVAGEFGGGAWAVQRADLTHDSVDYTDWRLILGLESTDKDGTRGFVELGYVFNRKLRYESLTPDFEPADTVMLRVGCKY